MIKCSSFQFSLYHLSVYREQAKTDKSKKGTSNISSASTSHIKIRPGQSGPSISAKGKGKEKEKMSTGHVLPPPFTSAPLAQMHDQTGESVSTGSRVPMDIDWEEELGENGVGADTEDEGMRKDVEEGEGEGGEVEGDGPEDEEDDIVDEEDEGTGEALEDPMEVEEEELVKDSKGLDDPEHVQVVETDD
jgi:DNA polymerase epsilon subunit 3